MNKAIFMDRDGTININHGYVYRWEDFEFVNGAVDFIRIAKQNGFLVIVLTNQAGIARGYYTEADMHALHQRLNEELNKYGAQIDAFYFCPHHPTAGIGDYKIDCNCRKPKTGMLEQAIRDFDIDVNSSYFFGDKKSDIQCGEAMGVKSFLVGRTLRFEDYIK